MSLIGKTKKPKKLSLFLAKPNKSRTIIDTLKHIHGRKLIMNFGSINELEFSLPYEVVMNNILVRNPSIDKIKEKYFIKAKFGELEEWFLISKISKSSNDSDSLTVKCYSLGYQLRFQKLIDYEVMSYNCLQVLTDCLKGTGWKVGYIHPDFNLKFRQFDVSSSTKLEFLYSIAETFEGVVVFNTLDKEVNIYKEEEVSQYKGFWVSYGKYLNTVNEEIDSDEIVTRLYIKGANGLTISSTNPTGQPYIDDFSYFLYPFETDEQGNVIQSSYFMDDDLALALTRYNQYVTSKKDGFSKLLDQLKKQQVSLTEETNRLTELELELRIILDKLDVAKKTNKPKDEIVSLRNSKQIEVNLQRAKIDAVNNNIKQTNQQISELKDDLKIENHLSLDLLDDLANFIQEDEWSDENQIDANDLYEAGLKRISEINSPPVNIKAGLINFFEIVEEQHNWDRLNIGDIVKIKHDKLNIWVQTKITQLVFDFDNINIDISISNSKRAESDLEKLKRAIYTIGKLETEFNNRKINWNQIAKNFNLRNDRISEVPTNPTLYDASIEHVDNPDGSVNLTLAWNYPDYNLSNKNSDNIDGFFIYLHTSQSDDTYLFGSRMSEETMINVDFSRRNYLFTNVPADLNYTIGIQAYRNVDEDINSDGILLSDIITSNNRFTNPYCPTKYYMQLNENY